MLWWTILVCYRAAVLLLAKILLLRQILQCIFCRSFCLWQLVVQVQMADMGFQVLH